MKNISFVKYLILLSICFLLTSICMSYKIKHKKNIFEKANQDYPKFLQMKNPGQPNGDSSGGNSGEFSRPDQVTEHILIPLLNTFEVEYTFAPDIKQFRKNFVDNTNKDMNRALGIRPPPTSAAGDSKDLPCPT